MYMYTQYKLHEIPSIGYLVMAEDRKKSLKLSQSKGNNSAITDDTLVEHHDIPSKGYLKSQTDGRTYNTNQYHSAFAGG